MGLEFRRGDILEVINQDDVDWWQVRWEGQGRKEGHGKWEEQGRKEGRGKWEERGRKEGRGKWEEHGKWEERGRREGLGRWEGQAGGGMCSAP